MLNINEIRKLGREFCQTEGSEHYKGGSIEPLDLMNAKDVIEDFCVGNMVKYAIRFKHTRNLVDLRKVSDYAQILAGVELSKAKGAEQPNEKKTERNTISGQRPDSRSETGGIPGETIPVALRCGTISCTYCDNTLCPISRASRSCFRSSEGNKSGSFRITNRS